VVKRIVPKDMPAEYRREYRELAKNEYVTFNQSIKDAIQKRHECKHRCDNWSETSYISYFMPSWAQEDDIFQELIKNGDINRTLYRCLDLLTPREYKVITLRFGIKCAYAMQLEEVCRDMHASRERIRQIEVKAIKHLRIFIRKLLPKEYWPKKFGYDCEEEFD
jgi:RNA polymerase sigma factor (sigma-70 family)